MFDFFYYKEKFQDLLYVFLTQLFKDVKATMIFFHVYIICLYFLVYSYFRYVCLYVCNVNMFACIQNTYKNINF